MVVDCVKTWSWTKYIDWMRSVRRIGVRFRVLAAVESA